MAIYTGLGDALKQITDPRPLFVLRDAAEKPGSEIISSSGEIRKFQDLNHLDMSYQRQGMHFNASPLIFARARILRENATTDLKIVKSLMISILS